MTPLLPAPFPASRRRRTLLALVGVFASALSALAQPKPNPPTAVTATDNSALDGVSLTWTAPNPVGGSGAISGYEILSRGPALNANALAFDSLAVVPAGTTSWTQATPFLHETYDYVVRTIDTASIKSNNSTPALFGLKRFDFVLPWNDQTTSATTDVRPWNIRGPGLAIDSDERVTRTADGRFMVRGSEIRFLGVNLSGPACFPATQDAPYIAARMAQFGINLVRFHQMDRTTSSGGIFLTGTTTLDPDKMTRLITFVKALRDVGVYSNINLRVSRTYAPPGGGPNASFKGIDLFHAPFIQAQETYAQNLLNYSSHGVTGFTTLAQEPSVAFIEIINEDGLLREWIEKNLDDLDRTHPLLHTDLGNKWAQWLRLKHTGDDAWQAAWAADTTTHDYGTEILSSGAREPALGAVTFAVTHAGRPWGLQKGNGSTATLDAAWIAAVAGDPAGPVLRVNVTQPSGVGYTQILLNHLIPDPVRPHTLEFYGRVNTGDPARTLRVNWRTATSGHTYYQTEIELADSWQKYTISFPEITGLASAEWPKTISFSRVGEQSGEFRLCGFTLTTGDVFLGPQVAVSEHTDPALAGTEHLGSNPLAWNSVKSTADTVATQPDGRAPGVDSLKVTRANTTGTLYLHKEIWETIPATALHHGRSYELSFDVRSSTPTSIKTDAMLFLSPWSSYGFADMRASTTWATKRFVFTVNATADPRFSTVRSRLRLFLTDLPAHAHIEFARLSLRELPANLVQADNESPSLPLVLPADGNALPATWSFQGGNSDKVTVAYDSGAPTGTRLLKITAGANTNPGASSNLLLNRPYNGFEYGGTYRLTFDAKASASFDLVAAGQGNATNFWDVFGSDTITVGESWSSHSVLFTFTRRNDPASTDVKGRVTFYLGQLPAGANVQLANISVRRANRAGPGANDSIEGDNPFATPITMKALPTYTRRAQTEWIRFLWETERDFLISMKSFITGTGAGQLQSEALIVGSQGEYSPTLLQDAAGMDVIDAHGYWNHPDKNNHFKNSSMAGVADSLMTDTTIAARAGRRILGKPYVISEYNHPGPGTYGTEAFPLFGAYAAMQGWNGLIAFDYDSTADWTKATESMFAMGRAPAKMITLPATRAMLGEQFGQHVDSRYTGGASGAAYVSLRLDAVLETIRHRRKINIGATDFGVPHRLAYLMPIGLRSADADTKAVSHRVVPHDAGSLASPYVSTTGQLRWDTTAKRVRIDTRMTKAVIGSLPLAAASPPHVEFADGVSISSTGAKLHAGNWACFVLTRVDQNTGKKFGEAGTRWLLTTTGYSNNHRIRWSAGMTPTDPTSHIPFLGTGPTLLESIDGVLKFKVPSGSLVAYALNGDGNAFGSALSVAYSGSGSARIATVTLPEHPLTPWYEMYVTTTP